MAALLTGFLDWGTLAFRSHWVSEMLARTKSLSFSGSLVALVATMALILIDIQVASAADQKVAATRFSGRSRHYWRGAPVITAPVVGVVTSGRLTTSLASRYGYDGPPDLGYYGGPHYYGGPYYYRPYFDGAGPYYFGTHPIVEW
jgi:hypothetical protein